MSVIVIQAQGAQRAMDTAPEQAREAMRSVETAARGGLEEMRRLLGLLTDANTTDGTSPQPSLEQLPDLIAQLGATGMPVDLRIEGSVRRLPAGLELTGYRIVQEAIDQRAEARRAGAGGRPPAATGVTALTSR